MSYLSDCLDCRLIFFTGKGGVGKSAVAWATAVACAKKKARVRFASWNPYENASAPLPSTQMGIEWNQLETLSAFREYALQMLRFEKVYDVVFENHVLRTFIRAAPGLSETVIAGKIWDISEKGEQDLLIVDLPASGHAFSFFQSPLGIEKIFRIGLIHKEAEKISKMFQDPSTRIDLVALPEEMSMVESLQFKEKLEKLLPFHFGFLHVNQCLPEFALPDLETLKPLPNPIMETLVRYQQSKTLEQETYGACEKMGMKSHRIPRFTTEDSMETIQNLADYLETI